MDVICQNCGATNRNTGRFCARCGAALPRQEGEEHDHEFMDLPWLQAVNEKAVLPTTGLGPEKVNAAAQPEIAGKTENTGTELAEESEAASPSPGSTEDAAEAAEPGKEAEAPDAPPPNWVVSILEPSSSPIAPEGGYEPEELAHIMPWAHKGADEEAASSTEGGTEAGETPEDEEADNAPPGLPPWLGNVTVQETLQSVPSQELRSTELADLGIEGIEPFAPPAEADASEQLPDFVRNMGGEGSGAITQDAPTQPAAIPVQGRTVTAPPANFTLEEDMAGIASRNIPVKAPRPGSVETLAQLLQPPAPESTRRVVPMPVVRSRRALAAQATRMSAQASRSKVRQWLFPNGVIYLVILAALLAVVIVRPPFGNTPAVNAPGAIEFYKAIDSVPLDRPVLVVYDWDAGRSAEMSIMSQAVMQHIMWRHLSFVTVSTVPQGPGFAQEVTDALKTEPGYEYEYGTDYLVLGYLPGSEAALRTLVGNFKALLPLDYINSRPVDSYQLTAGGALNKVEDFALIVDLAGTEAEMRNWIEQVASRTNVPVVAAIPQGLEPLARPYLQVPGAGLQAVVSGTTGAYAYMQQLEENGLGGGVLTKTVELTTRLNAQSVAALLAALVIVSAFLAQGARRIMRRG